MKNTLLVAFCCAVLLALFTASTAMATQHETAMVMLAAAQNDPGLTNATNDEAMATARGAPTPTDLQGTAMLDKPTNGAGTFNVPQMQGGTAYANDIARLGGNEAAVRMT